jgi:CRP/FNR family transcriptional regulator, cyclic AMP receptor protein
VARMTRATCLGPAVLYFARAEDLYGLMTRYPALAINVARYATEQRYEAFSVAEDFASLTVPERLVKLLERLAVEHGSPCAEGRRLGIRLTHSEIASLIGSTRETVTLQMGQLRREGRITTHGRDIVIV